MIRQLRAGLINRRPALTDIEGKPMFTEIVVGIGDTGKSQIITLFGQKENESTAAPKNRASFIAPMQKLFTAARERALP